MKTLDSIPTSKLERASKLVKTGVKIGVITSNITESHS